MQAILNGWFEIAVVVSLTFAISMWINNARARARRRAQELRSAAAALEAHYAAVSKLVEDPAFPVEAKAMLVALTEGISRKDVAEKLGAAFSDGSLFSKSMTRPAFSDDIEKLYQTRRDLAEAYQNAITSGLVALFLRWPGNSALFQRMAVEISTDVRKEGAIAGKLIEITRKLFDNERNDRSDRFGQGDMKVAC